MNIQKLIKTNTIDFKLSANGIIDAIFEIRFSTEHKNFELLLGEFIKETSTLGYQNLTRLAINDIPDIIIQSNPDLLNKPRWTVENEDYLLQVWTSVLIFSSKITSEKKYTGWEQYLENLQKVVEKIIPILRVINYSRVWMRYINFFKDLDILNAKYSRLHINFDNEVVEWEHYMQTKFERDNHKAVLSVSNSVTINSWIHEWAKWSMIDIDAYIDENIQPFTVKYIEDCHSLIKDTFFSITTDSFLEELKK